MDEMAHISRTGIDEHYLKADVRMHTRLFIDGTWVEATGDGHSYIYDPLSGQIIGRRDSRQQGRPCSSSRIESHGIWRVAQAVSLQPEQNHSLCRQPASGASAADRDPHDARAGQTSQGSGD